MEYKRMVVEAQTMVDEAKNKQKGKSVETKGENENYQSRQMVYGKIMCQWCYSLMDILKLNLIILPT